MKKDLSKIENWQFKNIAKSKKWKSKSRSWLRYLTEIGKQLYEKGLMPEVAGKPESTHGNMARRVPGIKGFIATASGSHKGKLKPEDFVQVIGVNWTTGVVTFRAKKGKKPTTDVWLADAIFKNCIGINGVIHAHIFPKKDAVASVNISYPPINQSEYPALLEHISGLGIVILANHGCIAFGTSIFGPANILNAL